MKACSGTLSKETDITEPEVEVSSFGAIGILEQFQGGGEQCSGNFRTGSTIPYRVYTENIKEWA